MLETTIGYDLRTVPRDLDWAADRRTRMLLRRDVTSLRSVDRSVWTQPPGLPDLPVGEVLWPDPASLLAAAAAHSVDHAGGVTVRITAFEEDGEAPENADPAGVLLGYDVADWYLLSGLTNCGYTPEEAAALRPAWTPRLNQWHLFDRAADATAFADVTTDRVPEHAPFFAYGIYRLD